MERLDLNFRAEPAKPTSTGLAAGWWLWCLVGLAAGYGIWWTSRHYLARRLSDQLATAQSPSDAFLALEGLLMLDSEATLEIARGLQHPNSQIARTAYRTLDAQISGWSQLESSLAVSRMRSLAQRLSQLPETTPPDSLVLASSLASRIFSICLELDDPQLAPVMTACETVFQRIGRTPGTTTPVVAAVAVPASPVAAASVVSTAELEHLGNEINSLRPPPPLADPTSNQFTLNDESPVPPIGPREVVYSSTSAPTAKVQFLTAATRPRGTSAALSDDAPATFSLSDDSDLDSESPQPTVVHGPTSLESKPLVQMRQLKVDVELENIEKLEIDQLVRLLSSVQPRVAQAASLALRSRGFPDDYLALASELATSSPAQRLKMLPSIATRVQDPRPWLLWMAEDGEPEVKQLAVSLLSSMANDLTVQRELRRILSVESNETVAQAIRQVLVR